MEYSLTESAYCRITSVGDHDDNRSSLEALLAANAETERQRKLYPTFAAELEVVAMRRPLTDRTAFSYFGLMLGSLPPASFFLLFLFKNATQKVHPLLVILMCLTILAASVVGYNTGKINGLISGNIEKRPFSQRIFFYALLGLSWGIVAGAAGGVFLFLIGAFFGAAIGGIVGAVALPLFSIPYLAMKRGGMIDAKHFLPISLGVTLAICSYILGFLYR